MRRSVPTITPLACLLAGACLAMLPACASSTSQRTNRPATGQASGSTAQSAADLYRSGQYSRSYDAAVAQANASRGTARDQAALLAGLSAHALNRNAEAVRWLRPLANNRDSILAGKAQATLGLIAQERNDHREAAELLTSASRRLAGDEAARAALYAGDSYRMLNQREQAREFYTLAQRKATSDANIRILAGDRLRGMGDAATATSAAPAAGTATIGARPTSSPSPSPAASTAPVGTLTVQVGAYRDRQTAEREAARLRGRFNVRIVSLRRDAGTLHAVRVGWFTNRQAAEQVRREVGGNATITTASGE